MKRFTRPLMALALVATGVLADRALTTTPPTASVDAAQVATTTTSTSVASSSAAADAAVENAYKIASPSVVYVENVGVGSGSGVIYDSTGDIVTNAHVVANEQSLKVTLSTGKTYTAKLVGTDTADDLAVIHIDATGLPAAKFGSAGSYQPAQTVLAIGSPLGLQETVTSGLVSAINRTVSESNGVYLPNAIQTSAPINPGNSGGALVTLDGTVVGIPTLEASDPQSGSAAQGIGFAIPSTRVTYVASQIISTGTVAHTGRAYLGVSAADSSAASSANQYGYGQGYQSTPIVAGAVVEQVASGSPAEQAGLQVGDVITAVNGTSISGQDDLLNALANAKPGETMALTVNRNGSTTTIKVTLGELSAS